MNKFCGLPTRVKAEPMFEEQARPIKKGMGLSFFRKHVFTINGVRAKQTISLINKAESDADIRIIIKSNSEGG